MSTLKTINKPIEIVVVFNEKGIPTPNRFKLNNEDGSNNVIQVSKVIHQELVKDSFTPKQHCYIFQCQSIIEDMLQQYELKFELETCKWFLYKI